MKILLAYNLPFALKKRSDEVSEEAVLEEVSTVKKYMLSKGRHIEVFGIDSVKNAIRKIETFRPDLIFNLCEGFRGDPKKEMNVAALWELLDIPYTGCEARTLALSQNKVMAKKIMFSSGIPTPEYETVKSCPTRTSLPFPIIVKPAFEDGSIGIDSSSVVNDLSALKKAVRRVLKKYGNFALLEKYIEGREFHVSIIGTEKPLALSVSETDFSHFPGNLSKIITYSAKWDKESEEFIKTPSICPAKISKSFERKLKEIALKVFGVFGGKDYARIDFRADKSGRLFVLEFNPNPDISEGAGYSNVLAASGISYAKFVSAIIKSNGRRKK
jgi:D-alanine-D-alanine ligase